MEPVFGMTVNQLIEALLQLQQQGEGEKICVNGFNNCEEIGFEVEEDRVIFY
ncbi:MAG: hypothetical protein WC123_07275 [Bacilli bacterium]